MSARVPVWLDCDPGHDDFLAILLACYHPGIELLGLSTTFGNSSVKNTTLNASSILTAIGRRDITVYQGAAGPIDRPPFRPPTDIHGVSGLDGTALLPEPQTTTIRFACDADPLPPAIPAMAAALASQPPGTPWVVSTGTLTNVALLLRHHPELASHLAGLSSMAGAIGGRFTDAVMGPPVSGVGERIGNWTPWAEWNVVADPEAAAEVFGCGPLRSRITMITLDLTHQVLVTKGVKELLLWGPGGRADAGDQDNKTVQGQEAKTTLRTMLVELLMFFAKTYSHVFGMPSPPAHDPVAVAAVLIGTEHEIPFVEYDPRVVWGSKIGDVVAASPSRPKERFSVKVVTDGTNEEVLAHTAQTGRTIATKILPEGQPGIRIPRSVDVEMFWRVIEECVERADMTNARQAW